MWLDDYALFITLRYHFHSRLWCNWPMPMRDKKKHALTPMKAQLRDSIDREKVLQYFFFKQWYSLRSYCNQLDIWIIGDIPIYVAYDSADVWAHPDIFKLTNTKTPKFIGGVPPDRFSRTGQLWGNSVYDWQALKDKGYSWWIRRVKHNLVLFDIARIDHFRGFIAYWQVPGRSKTAKKGRWVKGPSEDFFDKLFEHCPPSSIIVEDLGYITPDVSASIAKYQLSSTKVLQFAFEGDPKTNTHCPHNHVKNCVVYIGTHDNNTARGWFRKEATPSQKNRLFEYFGRKVLISQVHWALIRIAMSSVAKIAIIPMQDVLGLVEQARMNKPSTAIGNWSWRLCPRQLTLSTVWKLARLTEIYGRV
jgi:4-alpha-glucanotransferase